MCNVTERAMSKTGCFIIKPEAVARHKRDNDISHHIREQKEIKKKKKYLLTLPFEGDGRPDYRSPKLLALPATAAHSCSSGHFISLTWLHALVRRGLRIRFNWDYISIKTSSPLEREKTASNFGEDWGERSERGGRGVKIGRRGNNWYRRRAVISTWAPPPPSQRIKYACLPITRCLGLHVRRHPRQTRDYGGSGGAKRASKQRNLWPRRVQIIAELESTPVCAIPTGRLNSRCSPVRNTGSLSLSSSGRRRAAAA